MPVNSNKPTLWKEDIVRSVDLFNNWFMQFAPKAYRETRIETTEDVEVALRRTKNLTDISRLTWPLRHVGPSPESFPCSTKQNLPATLPT